MSSPLIQDHRPFPLGHDDARDEQGLENSLSQEETSPLGDYLADAESSFEPFESQSPFDPNPFSEDATIIARRRRTRGIPSFMRGSHSPQLSPLLATRHVSSSSIDDDDDEDDDDDVPEAGPSRIPRATQPPKRVVDEAFEERFKYMIATSGLLEKTHLDRGGSYRRPESNSGSRPASPTLASSPAPPTIVINNEPTPSESRWNFITAVGAVVFGVSCVLAAGTSTVVSTTALAAGLVLLKPQRDESLESSDDDDDPLDVDDDDDAEIASSPDTVYNSLPSSPVPESGADRVFASLESLLSKSRTLDQTITSSLQILAPSPDDTAHAQDLRIALHRLMDDMTDSLATCTSTLIPLADRTELSVLGEMYDIPVLGPRRLRRHSYGDRDLAAAAGRSRPSTPSINGEDDVSALGVMPSSPFDANDRFTKLPDRTMRQRRMSTSASVDWASPPSAYRPPRAEHSIPESNDEETGSESMMSTSTESSCVPASLPELVGQQTSPSRNKQLSFAPKRASPLAQTLERLEGAPGAPSLATSPPFPAMHTHTRVLSQTSSTSSSYRRSLQDIRYIPSSPPSSSDAAANLALARASANMSSANRRSLQMPLNPHEFEVLEQAIATEGANLHRARSLPHSQRTTSGLRPLATATSPPERSNASEKRLSVVCDLPVASTHSSPPSAASSRRTCLLFAEPNRPATDASSLGYGLAPRQFARPSRISSVSPLTLGGLKAAYLGVHLKRRRVACCLLGLRFFAANQIDDDYWNNICEALSVLGNDMSEASERLDVVRLEAEKEVQAARTLSGHLPTSPPPRYLLGSPLMSQSPPDFAPRDTTEQALLANVDELQRTLARVWARCDEMRSRVASGEADTLADSWSEVRTDIGGLLRHVERGRELARRDEREPIDEEDEPEETSAPHIPLPDFIRAWANPGPEELERAVDDGDDGADDSDPEDLPLPGVDEVFEADVPAAAPRAKSTMSREERIALTREARARGMTLAQLTAKSPEEQEMERQRQLTADRLRAETDILSELEGVFGALRRRKGMD